MSWLRTTTRNVAGIFGKKGGRPPFENWYIYVFCLTLGYLIANLGVLSVRPHMLPNQLPTGKPSQKKKKSFPSAEEYSVITKRNIFNSDGVIPPPKADESGDQKDGFDGPAQLSKLPIGLMGTIVHVDATRSLATVNLKNKNEMRTLSVDQEVEGLIEIKKIERRKVTFRNLNNNRMEYIEIPKDEKIAFGVKNNKPTGNIQKRSEFDFVLNRTEINKYTSDLPSILQQARMVPNIVPGTGGKIDGFRFVTIQPGSIYEKLGFKPMDVIKSVNGEGVNSPTRAMELYNALKTENRIGLTVERNGREENFSYDITE